MKVVSGRYGRHTVRRAVEKSCVPRSIRKRQKIILPRNKAVGMIPLAVQSYQFPLIRAAVSRAILAAL